MRASEDVAVQKLGSTRIGNAASKGKGIFATRPIAASTRVATVRGRPRWIWDIPKHLWPHTFQVDYDRYMLPRRNSIGWMINHSCDPNCVLFGMSIVTKRKIQKGEELTFDYSSNVDWPGFRMGCRCGSAGCRKVIRAYRFLPKELKLRYGRHVASFILREYFAKKEVR
jgi:hypothetical protein